MLRACRDYCTHSRAVLLHVAPSRERVDSNREQCSRIGEPDMESGPDGKRRRTMSEHVIVGAGPVGSATARLLAERGEHVRVVTRSGSGPEHPAIERIAADATDAERLTTLTEGAAALYNCASPQYHKWFTDWPP